MPEDQPQHRPIDPRASMGAVTLKVASVDRSIRFYRDILGFSVLGRSEGGARLGAGSRVLLELEEIADAVERPAGTTGLYHAAILVPTRADLGLLLARIAGAGIRFGQSDHWVSEALYLSDPDGNGLELYRDRPRDQWTWRDGRVLMAVDPLDIQSLYAEGLKREWTGLPEGTVIGHVHLNVGDLQSAEQFYHGALGFDIVASLPGALFVSAGGYHHHLGLNVWESRGGAPAPENSVGLRRFTIVLPDRSTLDDVVARLTAAGIPADDIDGGFEVIDPFGNAVRVEVDGSRRPSIDTNAFAN